MSASHVTTWPAALAAAILLSACASQETTRTGFLTEGAASSIPLQSDPADPDRLVLTALPAGVAAYHGFFIDEIAFRPGPEVPATIDAVVLGELKTDYRASLDQAFAQRFQRAQAAGPGVLRVRAAITGYERANVALNVIMLGLIGPVSAGGAATEAEVVDSLTGRRIAALATHTNGNPLMGGPIGYYTQHGHARRALARQAEELAEAVAPTAPGVR